MQKYKIIKSHIKLLAKLNIETNTITDDTIHVLVNKLKQNGKTDNYIISILNTLKAQHTNKITLKPRDLGLITKRYIGMGKIKPENVIGIGKIITYATSVLNEPKPTSKQDAIVSILLATTTNIKGVALEFLTRKHLTDLAQDGATTIQVGDRAMVIEAQPQLYLPYFYNKYAALHEMDPSSLIITTKLDMINKYIRELYVQLTKSNTLKSMGLQIFQRLIDTTRHEFLAAASN